MARKIRKDITVGSLEKKLGVAPGTIKNPDGRDTRSDKKLETIQKESAAAAKAAVKKAIHAAAKPTKKKTATKTTAVPAAKKRTKINPALIVTADQKTAAKRKVKSHPKTAGLVRKVRAAMNTSTTKK